MRTCSRCKIEKEENRHNFYFAKKGGYDYYCKECRKEINLANHYERLARLPEETTRICRSCRIIFPLNSSNFHYKNKARGYYANTCKGCRNEQQKEVSHKRREKKKYITKQIQEADRKGIEEQYQKALAESLAEDRKQGLDIADVKLKVGQAYKIKTYYRNEAELYQGILIQDCGNHAVFRNKNGRCESFLKVDLLLEHEYKEVN